MITRIYKSSQPNVLFVLPVVAAVFWTGAYFWYDQMACEGEFMPLYDLLKWVTGNNNTVALLLSATLVTFEGIALSLILQEYRLLRVNAHLPALLYIILMSAVPGSLIMHPALLSNFFLLFALKRTLDIVRIDVHNTTSLSAVFDMGFHYAVAGLFYFPSTVLYMPVFAGLLFFRRFSWREYIAGIIGLALPYLFAESFYFFSDGSTGTRHHIISLLANAFIPLPGILSYSFIIYILAGFTVISLLAAILIYVREAEKNKVKIRMGLMVFVWMLLCVLVMLFILPSHRILLASTAAIPLTVIFSNWLLLMRKAWLSDLWIVSLVALCIIGHWVAGK